MLEEALIVNYYFLLGQAEGVRAASSEVCMQKSTFTFALCKCQEDGNEPHMQRIHFLTCGHLEAVPAKEILQDLSKGLAQSRHSQSCIF
jgi:hypothetical protein